MPPLALPLSLQFPGRTQLYINEITSRIGCDRTHLNHLIDKGVLLAVDIGAGQRRCLRIPIESYADFIMSRYTGDVRRIDEVLLSLPDEHLAALLDILHAHLSAKGQLHQPRLKEPSMKYKKAHQGGEQ